MANRLKDIFENPHFNTDGMSANDVRQGQNGDCWLMSALCALSNSKGLLDKICVARDEKVGVYGFVFHRGILEVDHFGYVSSNSRQMVNGRTSSSMTSFT